MTRYLSSCRGTTFEVLPEREFILCDCPINQQREALPHQWRFGSPFPSLYFSVSLRSVVASTFGQKAAKTRAHPWSVSRVL